MNFCCLFLVLFLLSPTHGQWSKKKRVRLRRKTTPRPTTLPPTTKPPPLVCPDGDDTCVPPGILEKLARIGNNITALAEEFGFKNVKEKKSTLTRELTCAYTVKTFVIPVKPKSYQLSKDLSGSRAHDLQDNSVEIQVNEGNMGCIPRSQVVMLRKPTGVAILWPPCRYLMRCGGCCEHMPLTTECVPTTMSHETIYVVAIHPDNSANVMQIKVHHHLACKCKCRKEKKHCTKAQIYVEKDCQCMCETAKHLCPDTKIWSGSECGCVCERKYECTEHRHEWDEDKCKCDCSKEACPAGETRDWDSCRCVHVDK